jgi:hypothetical protein
VLLLKTIVTFLAIASQPTSPPKASIIARIGTSVLDSNITGFVPCESIGCRNPLTDITELPIHRLTTIVLESALASAGKAVVQRIIATITTRSTLKRLSLLEGFLKLSTLESLDIRPPF